MEPDLKVGDCVQLKHGESPKLTVEVLYNTKAKCIWFAGNEFRYKMINLNTLKPCTETKE